MSNSSGFLVPRCFFGLQDRVLHIVASGEGEVGGGKAGERRERSGEREHGAGRGRPMQAPRRLVAAGRRRWVAAGRAQARAMRR